MVLFYSEIKSMRDNQGSNISENENENVSFLPSSNIYERVRSEIPSNPVYNYNTITSRLDKLEKLINKIYTSNIDKKELRTSAMSFLSEFNINGEDNLEYDLTNRLLFKIKTYLFYILIALLFVLYKLYKINISL
jgi:hypothetical protein